MNIKLLLAILVSILLENRKASEDDVLSSLLQCLRFRSSGVHGNGEKDTRC